MRLSRQLISSRHFAPGHLEGALTAENLLIEFEGGLASAVEINIWTYLHAELLLDSKTFVATNRFAIRGTSPTVREGSLRHNSEPFLNGPGQCPQISTARWLVVSDQITPAHRLALTSRYQSFSFAAWLS